MANCLVTKLKEVVNNDNLPYFDAIVVTYKKKSGDTVINLGIAIPQMLFSGKVEILSGDGYFTNESGSVNLGQSQDCSGGSGESAIFAKPATDDTELKIKISPKTKLLYFHPYSYNIVDVKFSHFNYCTNLLYLAWIDPVIEVGLTTNDIASAHLDSLVSFDEFYFTGDIMNLVNMNNLTTIYADGGKLTGDFVQFCSAKRTAGISSGRLAGRWGRNVKLNGHVCSTSKNMYIDWDATSIIVKAQSVIDSNAAFTYGASTAQITELENAGYIVTVCD